jgi:mannitol/fructose-specific phosphotransferase system IIA component (Ntr-type)
MLISDLLKGNQILLDLQSTDGAGAIQEVASLLQGSPSVTSYPDFYAELLAREKVESTCLGNGVAFPHARTDHIKNMVLAIGRSRTGVSFQSCGQTVHLLFIIGTPKRMATDYLSIVGGLARLLKEAKLRDQLLAAADIPAFIQVLAEGEKKF